MNRRTTMTHLTITVALLLLLDPSAAFLPTLPQRIHRSSLREASTDTEDVFKSIELGSDRLQDYFSFPLDDWQLQAGGEIVQGHNVIVCAPTGAGKTVVGEMALYVALEAQQKAIYTTPLKALSNQKFTELRNRFGKPAVGLSTGDMSVNRDADIRVMTTEVYRNMAWRSSGLDETSTSLLLDDELSTNGVVVLDEFHYMGQPGRGGVWEESVITTPSHSQIVGLSATLPNALQLAKWMESVSGRKTILVEAGGARPVPLRYLYATKRGLNPLFRDENAGPGAPNGLLGLRGDGPAETKKSSRKPEENDTQNKKGLLPDGLQINPVLQAAARKRRARIDKAIDKMKAAETNSGKEESWNRGAWSAEPRRRKRLTAREERRQRGQLLKREMRKEVPSLENLVRRLDQKQLLPAIVFIFSRAGCDNSAQQVCQQFMGPARNPFSVELDEEGAQQPQKKKKKSRSRAKKAQGRMVQDSEGRSFRRESKNLEDEDLLAMLEDVFSDDDRDAMEFNDESPLNSENWRYFASAGLLEYEQVKNVAARVSAFNIENDEIAFDDDSIEQFLCGIGSHHAGMLPAHKAFVEALYQAQLMKLVFATETLAAGINMPARTTCICALAKRGSGSSMNLLETSNLLQMAGRAGRRGMDTDGTCVIVSTPFENENDASNILVSEIKPITSQFAPSYSLAVNLIARGQGRVDVAQRLVEKSFAMWEKRQVEATLASAAETNDDAVTELLTAVSHEQFVTMLVETFNEIIDSRPVGFDIQSLRSNIDMLEDRILLKRFSKAYAGAARRAETERKTLKYLEEELKNTEGALRAEDQEMFGDLADEDQVELLRQVETQRTRLLAVEQELDRHPFSALAMDANRVLEGTLLSAEILRGQLANIRKSSNEETRPLTAEDLSTFVKSIATMKKKKKNVKTLNSDELVEQSNKQVGLGRDATWLDMLALTKVLVSYGCLQSDWSPGDSDDALEASTFELSPAGEHIGMLCFDNSLWALIAMGGAYDVMGVSRELDDFRRKFRDFENDIDESDYDFLSSDDDDDSADALLSDMLSSIDEEEEEREEQPEENLPDSQEESTTLVTQLTEMETHELAGYVSCIMGDSYRRNNESPVESFRKLTPAQQRVTQSSLAVCERLIEVQKQCGTGDTNTRADLDLANVEVVTAWANGCSWSEALEISGSSAPGDLTRQLGRVLDALRQFGNLSYYPVRQSDVEGGGGAGTRRSLGISNTLRNKCRDAARAMDRYPVKDPLPFDTDSDEVDDVFLDDDDDNEGEE